MTSAMMSLAARSVVARLATDERTAHRITDVLAESFDPHEVAAGATDHGAGRWTVAIHFREAPNETAVRALVALAAGADTANALSFEQVAAADWIAESQRALPPVLAGRFVVHGGHDRHRVPANRIGIEIEAALAFGTGHHGTTRGCLVALDRILRSRRPTRILDLGTGSGVLAIATARSLQARVLASDIDAVAVRAARANARRNRAGSLVEVLHAAGLNARRLRERAPFDLILANILLTPLRRLAAPLAWLSARRACVVLSGILPKESSAAIASYRAQGFALERRFDFDGWSTLVLTRGSRHKRIGPDGVARHGRDP
jgi:ribosomal protein L11 methyltransferase